MNDSRGQIILIAALAIAVTFVALALIVNTAIFTENLATRETVDGGEAVAFQNTVIESGGALLWRANEYNNSSYESLNEAYKRDIRLLSRSENLHALSGGEMREIEVIAVHNGTLIQQTRNQTVNDTQNDPTWVVATGIHNTRRFTFTPHAINGDQFAVEVSDGASWWRMEVEPGSPTLIQLSNDGGDLGKCTVSENLSTLPKPIGVTNGSVNGSACSDLEFGDGVGKPYEITFENGTDVNATYQLTVDKRNTTLKNDLPENNYDGAGEPTLHPAIYNSTLHLLLENTDLKYSSNVTVAPEGRKPG